MRVVDPLTLEKQLVTRSYQLRYIRPQGHYVPIIKSEFVEGKAMPPSGDAIEHFTILAAMHKALSENGELDYIESQNVIIIRDTTQVHEAITEILRRLDVEPAQVFVDVKFVSTVNTDLLDLGVDYGDSGPVISMGMGQIPIRLPFNLGAGGFDDEIIANRTETGPFADPALNEGNTLIPDTIFGALSFTQVQMSLKLLQRDTKAEVIQAPKLVTTDGSEATIFVGETVRYAEAKTQEGQAGGLQLNVQEAEGSPVEVGFQLLVRPVVIPGTTKILMELIPKGNEPLRRLDGVRPGARRLRPVHGRRLGIRGHDRPAPHPCVDAHHPDDARRGSDRRRRRPDDRRRLQDQAEGPVPRRHPDPRRAVQAPHDDPGAP